MQLNWYKQHVIIKNSQTCLANWEEKELFTWEALFFLIHSSSFDDFVSAGSKTFRTVDKVNSKCGR